MGHTLGAQQPLWLVAHAAARDPASGLCLTPAPGPGLTLTPPSQASLPRGKRLPIPSPVLSLLPGGPHMDAAQAAPLPNAIPQHHCLRQDPFLQIDAVVGFRRHTLCPLQSYSLSILHVPVRLLPIASQCLGLPTSFHLKAPRPQRPSPSTGRSGFSHRRCTSAQRDCTSRSKGRRTLFCAHTYCALTQN